MTINYFINLSGQINIPDLYRGKKEFDANRKFADFTSIAAKHSLTTHAHAYNMLPPV